MKHYLPFIIIGCILFAIICFFSLGEGKGYGDVWGIRLICCGVAIAVAFVIHRIGHLLMWPILTYFNSQLLRFLVGFALGTWAVSMLILVFGSLGLLNPTWIIFVIVAINIQGWREWKRLIAWFIESLQKIISYMSWLEVSFLILVIFLGVLNFAHALLPPLDYDVLEYHLGAPSEYQKAGHIYFMSDNVYANFPQNLELQALLTMQILGKFYGAITAQILIQLYGIALFLAIFIFTRQIMRRMVNTGPKTSGHELDVHATGPKTSGHEPDVHATGPKTSGHEPDVHATGPKTSGHEPDVHATAPNKKSSKKAYPHSKATDKTPETVASAPALKRHESSFDSSVHSQLDSQITATAFISACLAYSLPWTSNLLHVYYVEIPQTFFLILALTFLYEHSSELLEDMQRKWKYSRYLMIGLLLGISAGFKYTILFFAGIAIVPIILGQIYTSHQIKSSLATSASFGNLKKIWLLRFIFLAIGFIVAFLPWMIRSYINTGNPIYPLFNDILSPDYWTPAQYAKFRQAHAPEVIGLINMIQHLVYVFISECHNGILFLALLLPGLIIFIRKMATLAIFAALWITLWLGFTHQIARFIFVIFVILTLPMAHILVMLFHNFALQFSANIQKFLKAILGILLILTAYQNCTLTIHGVYDHFLGLITSDQILKEYHPAYPAENFIQQNIPNELSSGKILVIGEARIFYLDHDIVASTVFDNNLLESLFAQHSNFVDIATALQQKNIRYIYFNWNEALRLQQTYTFNYQNKKIPGYLCIATDKLQNFLIAYTTRIFHSEDNKQTKEYNQTPNHFSSPSENPPADSQSVISNLPPMSFELEIYELKKIK